MKTAAVLVVLTLFPSLLLAQDSGRYRCSLDEAVRRVEIMHEPGVTVPCEVHYYKDTEMPGEGQVLWRASNEAGYCEAKAAEFVEKLRGMGWTCWSDSAGDEADDDAIEADDTDALAPTDQDIEIPESDPTG